jgi:glucose-6-phosphate dehydrogenase assembly protein OpcA
MATTFKVLGQSNPASATLTTLYTVPSAKSAVISLIAIANTLSSNQTFRIAVRPGGASIATQHYIAYDVTVGSNDTTALTLGLTLATGDVVSVYSSSSGVVFNIFGSEID